MKPLITMGIRTTTPPSPPAYIVRCEVPGEKFIIEVPSQEIADCIISALRYRQRHVLAERKRSRKAKTPTPETIVIHPKSIHDK